MIDTLRYNTLWLLSGNGKCRETAAFYIEVWVRQSPPSFLVTTRPKLRVVPGNAIPT